MTASDRRRDDALGVLKGLWRLVHAMEVRSKRMQRTIGVTGLQRLVIRVVGSRQDISAGEISDQLSIHASTLTGVLARLQRARLIARRADPGDGRRARFRLTARGRVIDRRHAGTVEGAVRDVVEVMPRDVLAHYQNAVARLTVAIEAEA